MSQPEIKNEVMTAETEEVPEPEQVPETKKRKYQKLIPAKTKEIGSPKPPKVPKEKKVKPPKEKKAKVAKVYECQVCTRKFERYCSFYSHVKQQHNDPSVPCPHCDKLFSSYALRNSHFFRVMNANRAEKLIDSITKSDTIELESYEQLSEAEGDEAPQEEIVSS